LTIYFWIFLVWPFISDHLFFDHLFLTTFLALYFLFVKNLNICLKSKDLSNNVCKTFLDPTFFWFLVRFCQFLRIFRRKKLSNIRGKRGENRFPQDTHRNGSPICESIPVIIDIFLFTNFRVICGRVMHVLVFRFAYRMLYLIHLTCNFSWPVFFSRCKKKIQIICKDVQKLKFRMYLVL